MVEVIRFPKKCPHCKIVLTQVKKMRTQWLECKNGECPFLESQEPRFLMGYRLEDGPYTCNYSYL